MAFLNPRELVPPRLTASESSTSCSSQYLPGQDFALLREVRERYFGAHRPTSTTGTCRSPRTDGSRKGRRRSRSRSEPGGRRKQRCSKFNRSASSCCSAQAAGGAVRGEARAQASAAPMRCDGLREADSVSR